MEKKTTDNKTLEKKTTEKKTSEKKTSANSKIGNAVKTNAKSKTDSTKKASVKATASATAAKTKSKAESAKKADNIEVKEVKKKKAEKKVNLPVRFHLPGLRFNYPLNMYWVSLLKTHPELFREGVEIGSFFGCFPIALWNGGRLIAHDQCDAQFITSVIKSVNNEGIPVRYTFTNPLLTEEDLKDPYCNFCMQAADNGMNEVMVFSPILEKYIREKYPSFAVNSSICKEIKNADDLNAELEKDYKYVVLDYNLNNHWDFIEGLSKPEKLEVLINALCTPACPRHGEHYRYIAEKQRAILENRKLPVDQKKEIIDDWRCEYGEYNYLYKIMDYPTFISTDKIWNEYLPHGINNFKIEGRTANLFSLIETYCYYMIKPECVGEARMLMISNLMNSRIITVNKPRPSHWP